MLLLTGPAYQGKLNYARRTLGISETEISFCSAESPELDVSARAVCGLHLWVRALLDTGCGAFGPVEKLRELLPLLNEKVILCDGIGGGVVPLERADRLWREATGRCLRLLAGEADTVLEFCCGIPRALKGELPQ